MRSPPITTSTPPRKNGPNWTCSPITSRSSRTGSTCRSGVAEGIDEEYLDAIAELVERLNPPWWSEHIAYTRAGGIAIGHLAALPWTDEVVEVVARNVDRVRGRIKTPLILENISTTVVLPGSEMDEVDFFNAVLDRTGCGLLCDVTNLYTNAVNQGLDLDRILERWPWDRVVQLHFAGGHWHDGTLIDSHAHPTPPEVWRMLDEAMRRAPFAGSSWNATRTCRHSVSSWPNSNRRGRSEGDTADGISRDPARPGAALR